MSKKREPKKTTELDDKQLEQVTGAGAGSFSAKAFNPQPEPPRPDHLFSSKLRARRRR